MSKKYINDTSIVEVDGQYGIYHELRIKPEELNKYIDEEGNVFVRLYKRKEIDKSGNTHYLIVNDNGKTFFPSNMNGEQKQDSIGDGADYYEEEEEQDDGGGCLGNGVDCYEALPDRDSWCSKCRSEF